jgi:hypothetical protein
MNYKTLIAFLGKNQMKDWATPSFDWVMLNNAYKLTDEANELGLTLTSGCIDLTTIAKRFFLSKDYRRAVEGYENNSVMDGDSSYRPVAFAPEHHWTAWYSQSKDSVVVFKANHYIEKSKALLETIN